MQKVGRNDPCPCGSGKKFKKCCESKMIGKKFMATKIDTSTLPGRVSKAFNVSSVFNPSQRQEAPKENATNAETTETSSPETKAALQETTDVAKSASKAKRTYTHKEKKKTE